MESLLNFGILVTLWAQSLGSWLARPMELISTLGTEQFFLLLVPVVYWCISPTSGLRFGLIIVFGSIVNCFLKLLCLSPRPYWYDRRVVAYAGEPTFGLPSWHAQGATITWGWLATQLRRVWFWVVAIVIIFLVSFSRVFLGVHFITDVLAGWLLGILVLWVALKAEKPVVAWFKTLSLGQQIVAVTITSLVCVASGFLLRWSQGTWSVPAEWIANAAAALPNDDPITPLSLSTFVSMGGVFLGMMLGVILLERRGGYDAKGTWMQYIARLVIGIIGLLILWMGLGAVFPRGEYLLAYGLRYVRYGLAGLWLTALAPLVFQQLKLAEKRKVIDAG
jgi:membrane-associated phospholipid phosphatase